MKTALVILFTLTFSLASFSQKENINRLLNSVKQAQAKIQTVAYVANRTTHYLQGEVISATGKVIIEKDTHDSVFGFRFKGKLDSMPYDIIYDGYIGYEVNTEQKTYLTFQKKDDISYLLNRSGGWLVVPELLKIDTSGAEKIQLLEDAGQFYLTLHYPDLKQYDIDNRRKVFGINKQTMLPVSVRSHQESLGKIQDIYWEIKSIQINKPLGYNFSSVPFLQGYTLEQPAEIKSPSLQLKNKIAPGFSLAALDGQNVSLSSFKGQVVLLDFWEVWCGPCIASMPKVQALYDKYKSKGLVVYGIINDLRNIQSTKEFVKKRSIKLPVLIGNEQIQKDYKLDGTVPLYILISKNGEVSMVQMGFSDDIELLIRKELEI